MGSSIRRLLGGGGGGGRDVAMRFVPPSRLPLPPPPPPPSPRRDANHCYSRLHRKLDYAVLYGRTHPTLPTTRSTPTPTPTSTLIAPCCSLPMHARFSSFLQRRGTTLYSLLLLYLARLRRARAHPSRCTAKISCLSCLLFLDKEMSFFNIYSAYLAAERERNKRCDS